jgi:predicted SAM-dependent methyltransferase
MSRKLAFAPGAQLEFRAGLALIRSRVPDRSDFQTDQSGLIAWLARFAAPVDLDLAMQDLAGPGREIALRAVSYLLDIGVLVEPGASAAATAPAPAPDRRLSALSVSVYELACDVLGLGPAADMALTERTGVGLDARLATISGQVESLRQELATMRGPYLAAQLRALGVGPDSRDLQLHIGCGPCHLPGWINLDIHPAPLATNVLWGLPFVDGSVSRVFLSHLLEHLFYPNDVLPFLAELQRVLAPGGRIRVVVPDIEQCLRAYAGNDDEFFRERREHWPGGDASSTRLEHFLAYAGAGPDPAHIFQAHKFGYDFETLARALARAGFVEIERSGYMQSRDVALRVDENSEVAGAVHGGRYYSLFVEATKPETGVAA